MIRLRNRTSSPAGGKKPWPVAILTLIATILLSACQASPPANPGPGSVLAPSPTFELAAPTRARTSATRTPTSKPAATRVPANAARAEEAQACAAFDNQIWAQTVYDENPRQHAALDPDHDRLACNDLPDGIAPALWTDRLPANAERVTLDFPIDGDTIAVRRADGEEAHVRLVEIDSPETGKGSRALECFGLEASAFAADLLSASGGVLYLERDREDRDQYDRLLRYVWFEAGGEVYMLNEAMVRSGYANPYRNTPNLRYMDRIIAAEAFARAHGYGLWSACR